MPREGCLRIASASAKQTYDKPSVLVPKMPCKKLASNIAARCDRITHHVGKPAHDTQKDTDQPGALVDRQ